MDQETVIEKTTRRPNVEPAFQAYREFKVIDWCRISRHLWDAGCAGTSITVKLMTYGKPSRRKVRIGMTTAEAEDVDRIAGEVLRG